MAKRGEKGEGEEEKEKERRLKIGGGDDSSLFSYSNIDPDIYVYIYVYTANDPSAPCIPDVREEKPLAESFLYDVPERLRVGEVL